MTGNGNSRSPLPILNQQLRVDNFDVAPSLDLSVCESLQYLVSICFSIRLVARQLRMRSSSSFPTVSSQSDRLFRRQKRAAAAVLDKILSARRLLPGNCLSVFECVPQEPVASILPLCEDKIAYFARTPPDQTLPCIARLAPSWQLCSGQMMYAVCGFIKAFSNEPLCRLISAESPISGLCVRSSLLLFPLPAQYAGLVYGPAISGRENNKTSRCPRQSPLASCHSTASPFRRCYCCQTWEKLCCRLFIKQGLEKFPRLQEFLFLN